MIKKKNTKNNYLKLFLILLGVILLTIVSSNLYRHRLENKINNSYISKHVANIQFNELKNAKLEFNSDTFLYVSYTGNSKIHEFEVKVKKILRDNEIIDNMIYLDITELKEDNDFIHKLNEILELDEIKISKVPAIIYFKDNKVIDIIDSENSLIDSGKFVQLLEQYELVQ